MQDSLNLLDDGRLLVDDPARQLLDIFPGDGIEFPLRFLRFGQQLRVFQGFYISLT